MTPTPDFTSSAIGVHWRDILGCWLLLLLPGCTWHESYLPDAAAEEDAALVQGYWRYRVLYDEELLITGVDGQESRDHPGWPYARSASIPAGTHRVSLVILRNSRLIVSCEFQAPFEPRFHYRLEKIEHNQALLAHPETPSFKAFLRVAVVTPAGEAQSLRLAADCWSTRTPAPP